MTPQQQIDVYTSLALLCDHGAINKKQLKEYMNVIGLNMAYDKRTGKEYWTDGSSKTYMARQLSDIRGCCGEGCCDAQYLQADWKEEVANKYEEQRVPEWLQNTYNGC